MIAQNANALYTTPLHHTKLCVTFLFDVYTEKGTKSQWKREKQLTSRSKIEFFSVFFFFLFFRFYRTKKSDNKENMRHISIITQSMIFCICKNEKTHFYSRSMSWLCNWGNFCFVAELDLSFIWSVKQKDDNESYENFELSCLRYADLASIEMHVFFLFFLFLSFRSLKLVIWFNVFTFNQKWRLQFVPFQEIWFRKRSIYKKIQNFHHDRN